MNTRYVRVTGLLAAAVVLSLSSIPLAGQATATGPKATTTSATGKTWTPPKTPWGDPDLQGTWTSDLESGVPFERPDGLKGKVELSGDELEEALEQRAQARAESAPLAGGVTGAGPVHWYENWHAKSSRTSMVIDPPDGRVPALTAEAQKRNAALAAERAKLGRGPADSWEDRSLYDRCITRGIPGSYFPAIYNSNIQIVQAPGYAVITHEMIHEARIVPLDGRPHLASGVGQYMGDSRGRWEGNTLVVDVTNFTDKTNYRGSRQTLHLIERFTRVGPDAVRYEVTIDDPKTFTRTWTAALNLSKQSQIFEYACHEGNLGLANILSGARADERKAAEEAAAKRKTSGGQ